MCRVPVRARNVLTDTLPKPRRFLARMMGMTATVLVLPGGKPNSLQRARSWHLSSVRMRPFTSAIREAGADSGIHVVQVQYQVRGWNRGGSSAITDVRRVMADARRERPGAPIVLVGHSMGGRVAAHLAAEPDVLGVVALAPWWPGGEGYLFRSAQHLAVLHGTADRWTSPDASRREVIAASRRGVRASWTPVENAGHFMLRHPARWHAWVCEEALRIASLAPSQ
ncbi:pimeloyl-ACP methyl ester carboxylesterase [Hoyosella altamirensis]|uniref:Pimeloyl-ACP methyl ester carboxylesterase n=2 Tax=Hoyosella altamirensis TaxID=616997 RepID=A0A839RJ61_9ACTN|nr:pimeloyl-ACP methyl ester carboxylesterase [Hoyosella altamirensis]